MANERQSAMELQRNSLTGICRVRPLELSRTTSKLRPIFTELTPVKFGGTSDKTIMYFDFAVPCAGSHLYVDSSNSSPLVTVSRRGMGKGVVLNSKPRQNSRPFHGAC